MDPTNEAREISEFIKELESDEVQNVELAKLAHFTKSTIKYYSNSDLVETVPLEKLLESILKYCLNEKWKQWKFFDKLLNCFSDIVCSLALQGSKDIEDYVQKVVHKVIINLFNDNIQWEYENTKMLLQSSDLSDLKMATDVKIALVKIMNKTMSIFKTVKWTMYQEMSVTLLLMLHKMSDLIAQVEYNWNCVTGLSKDDLLHLYNSVVEYFHNTSQDYILFNYLNLILSEKKNLTIDVKFFIITTLWDHLSTFYNSSEIIIFTKSYSEHSTDKTKIKDTLGVPNKTEFEKLQLESFFISLKEFCLVELSNTNQQIRKSAIFILQSLYQIECNRKNSEDMLWRNFFHVFETLEESQVHLIFPVIDTIDAYDSLLLGGIILARMFQNDNVSVIKEGIKRLYLVKNDPSITLSLLSVIMKALNNLGLYYPESESIEKSIVDFFQLLNTPYTNVEGYLELLNAIIAVPWGPVPLFYVSKYLQLSSNDLNPDFQYDKHHLPKISSIFTTVTKLLKLNHKHNRIIRSAIDFCFREHLRISIILPLKLMNMVLEDWDLVQVLNNLLNASKFETETFYSLLQDLSQSLAYNEEFVNNYVEKHFFSPENQIQASCYNMIVLFLIARKITSASLLSHIKKNADFISKNFENLSTLISFLEKYPFVPAELWCRIVSSTPDKGCCFIHSFLAEDYTEEQFKFHLKELLNQGIIDKFEDDIEFLMKHGKLAKSFVRSQLFDTTIDFFKKKYGFFETEYNYLCMFNLFYNTYGCDDDYFKHYENQLHFILNKDVILKCENRKSVELKLRMFLRLCQGREGDEILLNLFIFSGLCNDCLANVNRDVLPVVLEIMEILMPYCIQYHYDLRKDELNEIYLTFLKASYQEVQNSKKTTSFRSNMSGWIFSIFPVLSIADYHIALMECIDDFLDLEEPSYTLFKRIARNLRDSICEHIPDTYQVFLVRLLTKGLIYGDLLKKDILAEHGVCELIRKKKMGHLSHLQFNYSLRIRYKCLYIMKAIARKEESAILLLNKLKEVFESKEARIQYFNNSLTHRVKLRALQAIVILDHLIEDVEVKQELVVWALDNIFNYNHQPSIRYFLEWLIIKNLEALKYYEQFWSHFDRAYDERPGSIVSFLCIIFHVVQRIITSNEPCTDDQVKLTDEALERIHLCSMSQLFNLRLYANVIFIKLYEAMGPDRLPLKQKYQMVYNVMIRTKESAKGNAILNAEKLNSDFYFTSFRPFSQFTLETIFYDLPRLSGVASDEWQHWREILDTDLFIGDCLWSSLEVWNKEETWLKNVNSPEWIVKCTGRESEDASFRPQVPDSSSVSQKKFIPCTPDISSSPSSELIIVTSLIDKTPNIGGLSRSCEVFGATLVVDSLNILRDAEFKALSMTSEKHANIVEVKKHNLKTYLMDMRRNEGYQIIGAEQTTNSVNLQDFKYPKKCILVLGNEKDGIRSDILVLLDSYVEIPQLGVLRSLNVHVTGAVFMWEYVKQHCLSPDT